MPRLPSAEDLGRRPAPSSGRGVYSADTSAVPRAIAAAGGEMARVADEYQRGQDANAVFEARRKLDDWERNAIFGEQGASRKLGKDAFGVPDELEKGFEEIVGKVTEGLGSERQRKAFAELAASRRAQVLDWGAKHALREKDVYEVGQFNAELGAMADRAALFPDRASGELAIGSQRIIGFMRDKGKSTEEIDQALKENASRVHTSVLTSMLNAGNGEQAQKYLSDNRESMSANAIQRAESTLKEVAARSKAQAFGDSALTRGISAEEALREARANFSGIEEDAAVNEIKTRYTEAETLRKREQAAAGDEAWKIITNGGSRKQIPASLWSRLGGDEQRQINDYTEAKWRRAKAEAGGDGSAASVKTDVKRYVQLRTMFTQNPEAFAKYDLEREAPFIAKQEMEQLLDLRDKARSPKEVTDAVTLEQQVSTTVNQLGLSGASDQKKKGELQMAIHSAIYAEQSAKGKKLTQAERQSVIDQQIMEVTIEKNWWPDSKKRAFELTPEERSKVGGMPQIKSEAEWQSLPKGTKYKDPNGVVRTKQ